MLRCCYCSFTEAIFVYKSQALDVGYMTFGWLVAYDFQKNRKKNVCFAPKCKIDSKKIETLLLNHHNSIWNSFWNLKFESSTSKSFVDPKGGQKETNKNVRRTEHTHFAQVLIRIQCKILWSFANTMWFVCTKGYFACFAHPMWFYMIHWDIHETYGKPNDGNEEMQREQQILGCNICRRKQTGKVKILKLS